MGAPDEETQRPKKGIGLPRLYSVRQVHEQYGVSKRQIYRWHQLGLIPGVSCFGTLRFAEEDLLKVLQPARRAR